MSKGPEAPHAEMAEKERAAEVERQTNYEALDALFGNTDSLQLVEGWDVLDTFSPEAERLTAKVTVEFRDNRAVEGLLSQVVNGGQADYHLVMPDSLEKMFDTQVIREQAAAMEDSGLTPPAQFNLRGEFTEARNYFNTFAPQIRELQPYLRVTETD